jgi:hypothetical protein
MWSTFNSVALASIVGLALGFFSVTALLSGRTWEGIEIKRVEYGDRWPFAIEQGHLRCEEAGAIVLTARGKDYAVNGMAARRYAAISPILHQTEHVSVGPIISRGLTLCNW